MGEDLAALTTDAYGYRFTLVGRASDGSIAITIQQEEPRHQ